MADWYEKSFMKDEDFQEEEVWDFGKLREEPNPKANKSQKLKRYSTSSSSSSYAWTSIDGVGASRAISMGCRAPHHPNQQQKQQSSAPMRIPDWSKIYREKTKISSDGYYEDNALHGDDDEMMPPHEYINRRVARSQIASFSMCEGVGRTLKGRDLSKVRNAILTKTGFLE